MAYKEEAKKSKIFGYYPIDYDYTILRNTPIYSQETLESVQNWRTRRIKMITLMETFELKHKDLIEKAKEKMLKTDLYRCIETVLNMQLLLIYPSNHSLGSMNVECNHWKHRCMIFSQWLRGGTRLSNEIDLCDGISFIIPEQLKEEIER